MKKIKISGRLIAAGRALANISQEDFAAAIGISTGSLCLLEAKGSALIHCQHEAELLSHGMERIGVVVLDESDGMGAGIRLKFTRQDARQLMRLENEGGKVGCDRMP